MAEYLVQDTSLTAIADAIREKGGTTDLLNFPVGMVEAVRNIQSGDGGGIYVGNFPAYPQFAGYNILPVIETGTFEVET